MDQEIVPKTKGQKDHPKETLIVLYIHIRTFLIFFLGQGLRTLWLLADNVSLSLCLESTEDLEDSLCPFVGWISFWSRCSTIKNFSGQCHCIFPPKVAFLAGYKFEMGNRVWFCQSIQTFNFREASTGLTISEGSTSPN